MPKEFADRVYSTSFTAAMPGAYYARGMEEAERAGRLRRAPWEPKLPVTTAWDLGIDDVTAIIFAQVTGAEVRLIDYLEQSGEGLAHYAKRLQEKRYRYAEHVLPHDADVRELGTGKSRAEVLRSLVRASVRVLPALPVADGIEQARLLLPRCYVDAERLPAADAGAGVLPEGLGRGAEDVRATAAARLGQPRGRCLPLPGHRARPGRLAPRPPIKIAPPRYAFTRAPPPRPQSPAPPRRWRS